MNESKTTKDIRNFINNGLQIRLTPGNGQQIRDTAFAFQTAIHYIGEDVIQFLINNPNAKIRVQRIKPKPSNVLSNARLQTRKTRS